jgi:spermidine synthase
MNEAPSSRPSGQRQKLIDFIRRSVSPAVQKKYIENISRQEKLVYTHDTADTHYEVVDMLYSGRPARVLFSGQRQAAQSGVALDGKSELLFDYNQRFMELAASLRPTSVLLIGGGVYTLPMALLAAHPKVYITIIEPDRELDGLARRFFGWKPPKRARVIHTDGRTFLARDTERYDLILIDAFSYTTIPKSLLSVQAIQAFRQHLKPGGTVGMNIISPYYGRGAELIRQQHGRYTSAFKRVEFFPASRSLLSPWLSQNYVLVARNSEMPGLRLRFAAMPPPAK